MTLYGLLFDVVAVTVFSPKATRTRDPQRGRAGVRNPVPSPGSAQNLQLPWAPSSPPVRLRGGEGMWMQREPARWVPVSECGSARRARNLFPPAAPSRSKLSGSHSAIPAAPKRCEYFCTIQLGTGYHVLRPRHLTSGQQRSGISYSPAPRLLHCLSPRAPGRLESSLSL